MVAGSQQGGLPALLVKEPSDQLEALLKVSHSTPITTQSVWIAAFQVACPRFCHLTLCGNETASMFQVELECQRGRVKCGRSLSGKDDFAEHKYLVGTYQLPYQILKTAPHRFFKPVAAKGSAELLRFCLLRPRRAWPLPLPFLSLILMVFSPIFYTYRWAPPLGASGLSWRCCTAHTAEACLPWDLATATASTSWRAV